MLGGDDEGDFDRNVDCMRELSNADRYHVKSIWRDTFSGKRSSRVYFDVYACDKLNKGDVLISGSYTTEHKVRASSRSAWLATV